MPLTDAARHQLITALHASGHKAALAITGGGSGAIGALLRVPGGSRLLIEAQVPYDSAALAAYLGAAPAQTCSADTAIAMARAARARAALFAPADSRTVGLGATAALISDRPRKGEHRFHIACATSFGVAHCSAVLAKGRRIRADEEDLVADAIIVSLARACGVAAASPKSLLGADEAYADAVLAAAGDPVDQLVAGAVDRVTAEPDGRLTLSAPRPLLLMPGSFNPLHLGHLALARVAEEIMGRALSLEISVTNVDKPPLEADTIRRRLAQFERTRPVELTRAPTFVEKARLYPNATFVIGADTAQRLFVAKYHGDEARMYAALDEIVAAGVRFLVAVRADDSGRLLTLGEIAAPVRYAGLFTEIPEARFRLDVSSSNIRARSGS